MSCVGYYLQEEQLHSIQLTCTCGATKFATDMKRLVCRDNLRGFFEQSFSLLLKQIFGFDGSSWLNIIAKACFDAFPRLVLTQKLYRLAYV